MAEKTCPTCKETPGLVDGQPCPTCKGKPFRETVTLGTGDVAQLDAEDLLPKERELRG